MHFSTHITVIIEYVPFMPTWRSGQTGGLMYGFSLFTDTILIMLHVVCPNPVSTSQLIAHSSRVRTPMRHHSESVLYMAAEDHAGPLTSGDLDTGYATGRGEQSTSRSTSRPFAASHFADTNHHTSSPPSYRADYAPNVAKYVNRIQMLCL